MCFIKARERMDHLHLHVFRQAGRKALQIELLRLLTHRLDEYLVAALIRETHEFIFDRRAVSRARSFDHAAVERRSVHILRDDLPGLFRRPDGITRDLIRARRKAVHLIFIRKRRHIRLSGLDLHDGSIHGPGVDTHRRSGLKALHRDARFPHAPGKAHRTGKSVRTALDDHFSTDRSGFHIGSGADDDRFHVIAGAGSRADAVDPLFAVPEKLDHFTLHKRDILFFFDTGLHLAAVGGTVHLRTRREYRRTFGPVQHAGLDRRKIGHLSHNAAQRIDLTHQLTFCRTADAGVTGKICQLVQMKCQKKCGKPQMRAGKGRFAAGMSGADYGHVKSTCIVPGCVFFHLFPVTHVFSLFSHAEA